VAFCWTSACGRPRIQLACTPIIGAAMATRSSNAAVNQVCMPPRLSPVIPILLASTSGRVSK
jgi:hypothetical protein